MDRSSHTAAVTLRVNGVLWELVVDHRTTVLDALREHLGLTGAKKSCDHGQCGACTVLVGGRRMNACLLLAVAQDGAEITTVEGLSDGERLHPAQDAFLQRDALQCGYCTPGQICSAVGALDKMAAGWPSAPSPGRARSLPEAGLRVAVTTEDDVAARSAQYARRSFGAQFAEVQVDRDSGETRLRRLLGVFAAGRILNAGPLPVHRRHDDGRVHGLLEHSTMDAAFGDHTERDLASYHVAVAADVPDLQACWIEEKDPHLNPLGVKGIGEIGIVGTAAAVANAVYDATGVRVRTLPIRVESLLPLT